MSKWSSHGSPFSRSQPRSVVDYPGYTRRIGLAPIASLSAGLAHRKLENVTGIECSIDESLRLKTPGTYESFLAVRHASQLQLLQFMKEAMDTGIPWHDDTYLEVNALIASKRLSSATWIPDAPCCTQSGVKMAY